MAKASKPDDVYTWAQGVGANVTTPTTEEQAGGLRYGAAGTGGVAVAGKVNWVLAGPSPWISYWDLSTEHLAATDVATILGVNLLYLSDLAGLDLGDPVTEQGLQATLHANTIRDWSAAWDPTDGDTDGGMVIRFGRSSGDLFGVPLDEGVQDQGQGIDATWDAPLTVSSVAPNVAFNASESAWFVRTFNLNPWFATGTYTASLPGFHSTYTSVLKRFRLSFQADLSYLEAPLDDSGVAIGVGWTSVSIVVSLRRYGPTDSPLGQASLVTQEFLRDITLGDTFTWDEDFILDLNYKAEEGGVLTFGVERGDRVAVQVRVQFNTAGTVAPGQGAYVGRRFFRSREVELEIVQLAKF